MAGCATGALAADPLKLGVLTDMSSLNTDPTGAGSVLAVQMAVEDFGGKVAGRAIEVVSADHLNKADTASGIARQWFDQGGVDGVFDAAGSAVALAVNELARSANKVLNASSAVTTELSGKSCSPNTVQFMQDNYAIAAGVAAPMVRNFGKRWFFMTVDYTFGTDQQAMAARVIEANGGSVVGTVRTPLNTPDFSSFMLQAQSASADILGLVEISDDVTRSLKSAREFNIPAKMKIATFNMNVFVVNAIGLEATQGSYAAAAFYWDLNDGTRAFSERFKKRHPRGLYPGEYHAGDYAAALHYLKAVDALGGQSADGRAVVAKMKETPTDDPLFGKGSVRADGRGLHPLYLFEVKQPSESKHAWDYFTLKDKLPAEEAALPLKESVCPLVTK
jgi:branched-chain amino acid transport system substrate-binding protein